MRTDFKLKTISHNIITSDIKINTYTYIYVENYELVSSSFLSITATCVLLMIVKTID